MEINEKKMIAAYALNLCTVSVSQIIDYDDLNVMEQEYDAVLNNLNLENMPHDEALLNILKQILDTITFFRIQEGDRKIVDMKYRQKMKNAIWSAAPNFGLIVAGGNPFTVAVSLASQIGIGYMNYRKTKAETNLDYEEQQWKLQRTAIEQLNGLQRELLDTAWRLADAYGFEDELRLSEKQIKHYDSILMDDNALRKYDRLHAIKDNFTAYPPFWYYFGSTANEIARDEMLNLSPETRTYYRNKAKEYFQQFWESNHYPLLREDQLASSCALEYADLLIEDGADKKNVIDLLDSAVKFAGNSWDVLQLCAMGYLKIGEKDRAVPALRILVNERYNTSVNAPILSAIYINEYQTNGSIEAKGQYESLQYRVSNPMHLMPWPDGNIDPEKEFYANQKALLSRRYERMLRSLEGKYVVAFNEIIPIPVDEMKRTGADFTEAGTENRKAAVEHILSSAMKSEYLSVLNDIGFGVEYVNIVNRLFAAVSTLSVVTDMGSLVTMTENAISEKAKELEHIQSRMREFKFTYEDYEKLQEITSEKFLEGTFTELRNQVQSSIEKIDDMFYLSTATSEMVEFCHDEGIPLPDSLEEKRSDAVANTGSQHLLSYKVLGDREEYYSKVMAKKEVLSAIIRSKVETALYDKSNIVLIYPGDENFNEYFSKCGKTIKKYKNDVLAILDDRSFLFDTDLLFTASGLLIVERNNLKEICPYESVNLDERSSKLMLGSTIYHNNSVDTARLLEALVDLKQSSKKG